MTGDVKSVAGVRVPLKITSVISSRLIACEMAGATQLALFAARSARGARGW